MTGTCGSDAAALRARREQLAAAGFADVTVLEHRYRVDVDAEHVIGHLYSALDEGTLPLRRRPAFADGVRRSLARFRGMQEDVPVTALVGRREPHPG